MSKKLLEKYDDVVESVGESILIVRKDEKWALADKFGVPLCRFVYDRISPIGEHCFKAGTAEVPHKFVRGLNDFSCPLIYEILDSEGNVLVDRSAGYDDVSEMYEGEVTVGKKGKHGIIDRSGSIIIALTYKYIEAMGGNRYLVSFDNFDDNYYSTIINRDGKTIISSEMGFRSIGKFHNHVARADRESPSGLSWGLIDDFGNPIGSFGYSFIKEWGEGYYKAEVGTKKNILRPDGTLVLSTWHHDVYRVQNGFFIFGNTIPKSKTNPETRYIRGVAHVSGDILFPMLFERVEMFENQDGFYAEIGTKPYILSTDGGIYDPVRDHLPPKRVPDHISFLESLVNWVMPGLQFFYRDTDVRMDVHQLYKVGETIRAGFYIDATTKLLKPAHRVRFLIASAHPARLYEVPDLVDRNPNVAKWNLVTFHFNSYFRVMDVYETPECTQVFLLHIPLSAARYGVGVSDLNLFDAALGGETSLVGLARASLDEKMTMDYHPRSFDEEWCRRMADPVGTRFDLTLLPLDPLPDSEAGEAAEMSALIHALSHDDDIEYKTTLADRFPWHGAASGICKGCVFAPTIKGKGEGCAELSKAEFRENYVKGRCPHRKNKLTDESEYEERVRWKAEKALDKAQKSTNVYAVRLLKEFVAEKLGGDIDRLKDFDLSTLSSDEKYGDLNFDRSPIVKALVALVFGGDWPGLSVDSINRCDYWPDLVCEHRSLFGANNLTVSFPEIEGFTPSNELKEKAFRCAGLCKSIGNLIVFPNKKASFGHVRSGRKYRGYMDLFLESVYEVMSRKDHPDLEVKGLLYSNRKLMEAYHGNDGFVKLVRALMLDPFVDETGKPRSVFMGLWSGKKELDSDTYLRALDEYITFCENFIPRRAERMVERLKPLLSF